MRTGHVSVPSGIDPAQLRLQPARSVLLVIDWQERLAAAMPAEREQTGRRNVGILLEAARRLGVPVVLSEQYPRGLGPTVPELLTQAEAAGARRFEKTDFACSDTAPFAELLRELSGRSFVVCGMESHVCVYQTVRGLSGAQPVFVVADAVCSRAEDNRQIGLELCRAAGAFVTSTEAVVFDWLGRAGGDDFKAISKLVR